MKPKTELQKRAFSLHKSLPPISDAQRKWAESGCFTPTAFKRKATTWCHECGTTFKEPFELTTITGFECPGCHNELQIQTSNKRTADDSMYFTVFARKAEFQVLRHFVIEKKCKSGSPAQYKVNECVQNWISPKGEIVNIARQTAMSIYRDLWSWVSEMEVRGPSTVPGKYDIHAMYFYPRKSIIPELARNGFDGECHDINPYYLLQAILIESKMETLLKAKQHSLLKQLIANPNYSPAIDAYWPSIKICIRNNYIVEDAQIWLDYIDLLLLEGKDVRNAHYACPENLNEAHDRCVERRQRIVARDNARANRLKAINDEPEYREHIKHFEDMSLKTDNITIEPLKTVKEVMQEADEMEHCLFVSGYHKRTDSLLLSAKVEGTRVETIEFSLKQAKVVQARGVRNTTTDYHNEIVELVNNNRNIIMERISENV